MLTAEDSTNIIIIPCRMGSTRFPGKPLALIDGRTMLAWVVGNAVHAVGSSNTFVATCDLEIIAEAEKLGVRAIMTSDQHERASDRTAEAVDLLEAEGKKIDSVLMLQGDEPTLMAEELLAAIGRLKSDSNVEIINLVGPIHSAEEWKDQNCIKVVADHDGAALYFSRLPVPHGATAASGLWRKQVCAIGFRRDALASFAGMAPSGLEEVESIDMLRWREQGRTVHLEPISVTTHPVDVAEDIEIVEAILAARRM